MSLTPSLLHNDFDRPLFAENTGQLLYSTMYFLSQNHSLSRKWRVRVADSGWDDEEKAAEWQKLQNDAWGDFLNLTGENPSPYNLRASFGARVWSSYGGWQGTTWAGIIVYEAMAICFSVPKNIGETLQKASGLYIGDYSWTREMTDGSGINPSPPFNMPTGITNQLIFSFSNTLHSTFGSAYSSRSQDKVIDLYKPVGVYRRFYDFGTSLFSLFSASAGQSIWLYVMPTKGLVPFAETSFKRRENQFYHGWDSFSGGARPFCLFFI